MHIDQGLKQRRAAAAPPDALYGPDGLPALVRVRVDTRRELVLEGREVPGLDQPL